jgi:uncharacterized protein YkwD/pSer/pThr/pTyr-binding forkhead associated (FHA) protein
VNRQVIIEDAEGEERSYELLDQRTVIGRGDDCEITLPGRSVSRHHIAITRASNGLILEDLGSSNGSLLNGEPVEHKMALESGDVVEIGEFSVHIDHCDRPTLAPQLEVGAVDANRRRADARRQSGKGQRVMVFAGIIAVLGGLFFVWSKSVLDEDGNAQTEEPPTTVAEEETSGPETQRGLRAAGNNALDAETLQRAQRRSAALETLNLELDQYLLQEDYRGSAELIARFGERHGRAPASVTKRFDEHIAGVAQGAVDRFRRQIGEGRRDLALAELKALINRLPEANTSTEGLRNLARQATATPMSPEDVADAGGSTAPNSAAPRAGVTAKPGASNPKPASPASSGERARFSALLDDIEKAWKGRDFDLVAGQTAALDAFRPSFGAEISRDLDRRMRLAQRIAQLQDHLAAAFQADPGVFVNVATGEGKRATVRSVDDGGVTFSVEGEAMARTWNELDDDAWLSLISKAKPSGEARLAAATFVLFSGRRERGQRMMREVERGDPTLVAAVHRALADDLGLDLPQGGFTWFDERYVTRQDLVRLGAKKVIADAVAKLSSNDDRDRADAYGSLHALGPRAASAFHRGLTEARDGVLTKAQNLGGYAKLAQLGKMREELEARREHALELIFDEYEYPYPHNAPDEDARHTAANQEIDRRKVPIKEIWESTVKAKISDELRSAVARIREYDTQLAEIGIGAGTKAPVFLLHLPRENEVTIRTFAWSADERERIDTSFAWMKENDERQSIAKDNERQQVAVTNDYRMMMGRHAVKMHDILVEAARMHSRDMTRLGFFAHDNPHEPLKRSPWDRLQWVGFYGSGASENIARNSSDPRAPHNAWLHSSGHHRNILGRGWRLLGSGNNGRNWTQNFSIREWTDEQREQKGLPKGGIRTRHPDKAKD